MRMRVLAAGVDSMLVIVQREALRGNDARDALDRHDEGDQRCSENAQNPIHGRRLYDKYSESQARRRFRCPAHFLRRADSSPETFCNGFRQSRARRSRNALVTTDTELMAIAAPAKIGDSNSPKNGYSTPAAIGTPSAL